MKLLEICKNLKKDVDQALNQLIQKRYADMNPLSRALRYALEGDGKRVRPLLCMLTARSFPQPWPGDQVVMPALVALEMIHTYSLVHDDLPLMDNDDMRRGRPTTHKVFGDAEALLAGDALLTDAFGVIADPLSYLGCGTTLAAETRLKMVTELSQAAGGDGMVLGQSQDLYWTQRSGATADQLNYIHIRKTGRLLGAASALGALAREATPEQVGAFRTFGEQLGLAFQITDDILDESSATGKTRGKDSASGKLTYLSYMGVNEAKKAAESATENALEALIHTGVPTSELASFAQVLLSRNT